MSLTPISSVEPHTQNPRVGNVEAIAESLAKFGQYKPIVVRRATGTILAGSHTWQAAKGLGWRQIDAVFVDVSDADAVAIMLADNRIGDLGTANATVLAETLSHVESYAGTGYTQNDSRRILADLAAPAKIDVDAPLPQLPVLPVPAPEQVETEDEVAPNIVIGPLAFVADSADLANWVADLGDDPRVAILTRLGFAARRQTEPLTIERVPVTELTHHPDNPREGDIGALCESLQRFGQYRPIVCNRATRHILAGNHTWQAIRALGWELVEVAWVEVDPAEETAIMLADNRTSELGGYDPDLLRDVLLAATSNLDATGYDGDDLDAILDQRFLAPTARRRAATSGTCRIGSVEFKLLGHHLARLMSDCKTSKAGTTHYLQEVLHLPTLRKVQ